MTRERERWWYWPPWGLTDPWRFYITDGWDEYGRQTKMFHAGFFGALIVVVSTGQRAQKAAKTRLKNRIGNGDCPCCNRHFADVERHIKNQHPDFTEDALNKGVTA